MSDKFYTGTLRGLAARLEDREERQHLLVAADHIDTLQQRCEALEQRLGLQPGQVGGVDALDVAETALHEAEQRLAALEAGPEFVPLELGSMATAQRLDAVIAAVRNGFGALSKHFVVTATAKDILVDDEESFSALLTVTSLPISTDEGETAARTSCVQVDIIDGEPMLIWGEDSEQPIDAAHLFADLYMSTLSITTPQPAPVQAIHSCKLGLYGRAFDGPRDRRAYTYEHQPDNVVAHRLGSAARSIVGAGDYIDTGLGLLKELANRGFGVFELNNSPAEAPVHAVPECVHNIIMRYCSDKLSMQHCRDMGEEIIAAIAAPSPTSSGGAQG